MNILLESTIHVLRCEEKSLQNNSLNKAVKATFDTVLSRFLAHAPLSEHEPLLEYRSTEVDRNIYVI